MPIMALTKAAEIFARNEYPEWKDLAKSFITLSSATLVFSLTFSEKIVNFSTARTAEKRVMFIAWCLLIMAIVTCGLAICALFWAQGLAEQQIIFPTEYVLLFGEPYYFFSHWAARILLLAGSLYTASLISLIAAAYFSMKTASQQSTACQPPSQ